MASVIRGIGLGTFRLQGSNSRSRSPTKKCSSAVANWLWSLNSFVVGGGSVELRSSESESVLLGYTGGSGE